MTFDMDLYYSMFIDETREQIDSIEENFLQLENEPDNMEYIHETFRMAHSIKGSSAAMNIETMKKVAHSLENVLSKIRDGKLDLNREIFDICFHGIDLLNQLHQYYAEDPVNIRNDEENHLKYKAAIDGFIQNSENIIKGNQEGQRKQPVIIEQTDSNQSLLYTTKDGIEEGYHIQIRLASSVRMKSVKAFLIVNNLSQNGDILKIHPVDYTDLSDDNFGDIIEIIYKTDLEEDKVSAILGTISELDDIHIRKNKTDENNNDQTSQKEAPINKQIIIEEKKKVERKVEKKTIRVDMEKIDRQIKLIGEFIIDKESINTCIHMLKATNKENPIFHHLLDAIHHMNYIGGELQEAIMSTRMLPLESLFNRFPRMIRDLAANLDKKVEFHIEGQETEVDRGIIEELVDPLTHILRNAIDHGLEGPEERRNKGKEEEGNLYLRAKHKDSHVIIEIEDDGKGLDITKIKNKIIGKGLTTEEELETLTAYEIIQYIFAPGFSTADQVSEVSGRGVGLDIVRANIGKLNGFIDIQTEKDKGSKFSIKLPLTLAIIKAMLIKEENYIFAIPTASIIEIIRLKNEEIQKYVLNTNGQYIYNWRNEMLPIISLGNYYEIHNQYATDIMYLIIVGYGERKAAFQVQKLLREQEVVIQSMDNDQYISEIPGIGGVSILGDGNFAYITEIEAMI